LAALAVQPNPNNNKEETMLMYSRSHRVQLGKIKITLEARELLHLQSVRRALYRHSRLDWGDVSECSRELNDEAFREGSALLSAYNDPNGHRFWILTDANRATTLVTLPHGGY
jgi:hypothetical protein